MKDNNSGNRNSGNWNSGNRNSGHWNSGYCNSGYCNSGNRNSGNRNSGYCNTGYCNSGDRNSGMFNTDEPKARLFNKESDWQMSDLINSELYPSFHEFYLTEWIATSEMLDDEKEENPHHKTTGGYLKTYEYKEAWSIFWKKTSKENQEKFLKLPNFSWDVFTEITGIEEQSSSCGR